MYKQLGCFSSKTRQPLIKCFLFMEAVPAPLLLAVCQTCHSFLSCSSSRDGGW